MPLSDNENRILQMEAEKQEIIQYMEDPLIRQPFTEDFVRRFSWSTNAIEGNTLSLEETIALIDYDEVRSNHTYAEYTDAKNACHAIRKMLLPFKKTAIDEAWIRKANGYIRHAQGEYRDTTVYIGNLSEAIYYPPEPQDVPALMKNWIRETEKGNGTDAKQIKQCISALVDFQEKTAHSRSGRNGKILVY